MTIKGKKVKYTKLEEDFYKKNKDKIVKGLGEYIPKNKIKKMFFGNVKETSAKNPDLTQLQSMNKVLRTQTFTSKEENFDIYKKTIFNKVFKGQKRKIKGYLGLSSKTALTDEMLNKTDEGWEISYDDKNVLLVRNDDTKTEGYKIVFA